uniref:alpha/beta fold hydrolase n=1 Tax=Belnapia mucosa TaxID=2804532 RepID=UPI0022A6A78F
MVEPGILDRHNLRIAGHGRPTLVFAHGYGCDQSMWRLVAPSFEPDHRTVLFDHVGSGRSRAPYDPVRYASLEGYAEDVLAICEAVGPEPVVFIGHSVSAMIGALAAAREPGRFAGLVMIGPSPRYIDDDRYVGGFKREDIEGLLALLEADHVGWANAMAPAVMGHAERPELAEELAASFCRVDPEVARHFARVTFTSDNRGDLARVGTPTLVLQCARDMIAPTAVGEYIHRHIPGSELVILDTSGHCPHLSAPDETIAAIRGFLARLGPGGHG